MIALLVDAVRALRIEGDPEHALSAWALLGTVSVLLVVSTFDAVLLLPAPALIAWGLLGALSPPSRARRSSRFRRHRVAALLLVTMLGGLSTRERPQVAAMSVYESSTRASRVERAAVLDPGSYRIHIRLAETYAKRRSCANVRVHAGAARVLYPNAAAPKRLLAGCGR